MASFSNHDTQFSLAYVECEGEDSKTKGKKSTKDIVWDLDAHEFNFPYLSPCMPRLTKSPQVRKREKLANHRE